MVTFDVRLRVVGTVSFWLCNVCVYSKYCHHIVNSVCIFFVCWCIELLQICLHLWFELMSFAYSLVAPSEKLKRGNYTSVESLAFARYFAIAINDNYRRPLGRLCVTRCIVRPRYCTAVQLQSIKMNGQKQWPGIRRFLARKQPLSVPVIDDNWFVIFVVA